MTTYSYLRVSTLEQNTEKNKLDVLKFANQIKWGSQWSRSRPSNFKF